LDQTLEKIWMVGTCVISSLRSWLAWLFPKSAVLMSQVHCYFLRNAVAHRTNFCYPVIIFILARVYICSIIIFVGSKLCATSKALQRCEMDSPGKQEGKCAEKVEHLGGCSSSLVLCTSRNLNPETLTEDKRISQPSHCGQHFQY